MKARRAALEGSKVVRLIPSILAALAAMTGTADAATVELKTFPAGRATGYQLDYVAAAGEANRLTVTADGGGWTFTDSGATITAGPGCESTGTTARCMRNHNLISSSIAITLGDGDDTFERIGLFDQVAVSDGEGSDTITNGGRIEAGAGADVYRGGTVSYAGRGSGVNVTLDGVADDGEPGEHDNVMGGGATGTDFADLLVASGEQSNFTGGAGDDVIRGGPAGDSIDGGAGRNDITAGGGDDFLRVPLASAGPVAGGPGRDSLSFYDRSSGEQIDPFNTTPVAVTLDGQRNDGTGDLDVDGMEDVGAARGWLVGSGADESFRLISGIVDGGGGDDDIMSEGTIVGGPGRDRIFAGGFGWNRGLGAVYAADGERDTIECGGPPPHPFEADPIDVMRGCVPLMGLATTARTFRADSPGRLRLPLRCKLPADIFCAGRVEIQPSARAEQRALNPVSRYGYATTGAVAPNGTKTVRLRLAPRVRTALRKGRRVRGDVLIQTTAANPNGAPWARLNYGGTITLKPPRR